MPLSLSHAIAERLRARILAHEWPPGTELLDSEVAHTYGVSRTPAREAMQLLSHEGLLQALPRRGMVIARLSSSDVQEAQTLVQCLEDIASKYAPITGSHPITPTLLRMAQQRLQLANDPYYRVHAATTQSQ